MRRARLEVGVRRWELRVEEGVWMVLWDTAGLFF